MKDRFIIKIYYKVNVKMLSVICRKKQVLFQRTNEINK